MVFAFACPNSSTAGGFLFDSLNCLDMWFSRSGLNGPTAYLNYRGIEQALRCQGQHLQTNVHNVGTVDIDEVEAELVTDTVPTV